MIAYKALFVDVLPAHGIIISMKVPYRKMMRVTVASLFLIIGVLGLALPILNGTLFIVAGLLVLSLEMPALERYLDKLGRKNLKINHYYVKFKHIIQKYF